MSRIYKVSTPHGIRLVEASTKSQAIGHCVSQDYEAEPVTSTDLYAAIQSGATVEQAIVKGKKDPAPTVPVDPSPAPATSSPQPATNAAPSTPTEPVVPAPQTPPNGWTPPTPAAPLAPPVNPVLAEQQRVNPNAAAAAGAPAVAPILPPAPAPAPHPHAPEVQWKDKQ